MPTTTAARTTRIDGVQLMHVGTWDAATGRSTVTAEQLAAAVRAGADRLIDKPPIKLGHLDARFQDSNGNPPQGDGGPAYGWVENLRLENDGNTLVGDLVGIPDKLAAIIPTAFRRRSVEIGYKVRSAAGKVYDAVITGLALLGESPPAVKGLDDVLALYTAQGNPAFGGITSIYFTERDTPNLPHNPIQAADADPERTQSTNTKEPTVDPKALRTALGLAEDATDEEVTKALTDAGLVPTTDTPDEKPDGDKTGATDTTDAPTGAPAAPVTPAAATPAAAPAVLAASAAPADGDKATIVVDRGMFAELQAAAQLGVDARNEQIKQHRDQVVQNAVNEGRISPATVAHYRALLDVDEAATVKLIADLPQAFPAPTAAAFGYSAPLAPTAEAEKADDERAIATFIGIGD